MASRLVFPAKPKRSLWFLENNHDSLIPASSADPGSSTPTASSPGTGPSDLNKKIAPVKGKNIEILKKRLAENKTSASSTPKSLRTPIESSQQKDPKVIGRYKIPRKFTSPGRKKRDLDLDLDSISSTSSSSLSSPPLPRSPVNLRGRNTRKYTVEEIFGTDGSDDDEMSKNCNSMKSSRLQKLPSKRSLHVDQKDRKGKGKSGLAAKGQPVKPPVANTTISTTIPVPGKNPGKGKGKQVSSTSRTWPEDWDAFLTKPENRQRVAPVHFFKHAPFADIWKDFAKIGLVVEVPNPHARLLKREAYWIATIREFAGYRALIEYERFGDSKKEEACILFCSTVPKPLGYADKAKKLLRAAPDIVQRYPNFIKMARNKLMEKAEQNRLITVQENHARMVSAKIGALEKYKIGTKLEVLDINNFERNQVATVTGVYGDRIHVTYSMPHKEAKSDLGHFLNVQSEHIHPLGWSDLVGHKLHNTLRARKLPPETISQDDFGFLKVNMALEVRHPRYPHHIAPAVVCEVLRGGFFMALVKVQLANTKEKCKMCFHVSSPYVFECGFAHSNDIEFPNAFSATDLWTWERYYKQSEYISLDLSSVASRNNRIAHEFEEGMKMEAVDLCIPSRICPATVVQVAGHLLRLHLDGRTKSWVDSYQWVDAESTDIYPLGWAEMVGHNFWGLPESAVPIENVVPKIVEVWSLAEEQEEELSDFLGPSAELEMCADVDLNRLNLDDILDLENNIPEV